MAIAPWSEEQVAPDTDPLLKKLRGDFFCAPFGANAEPWRGRKLPLHGETGLAALGSTGNQGNAGSRGVQRPDGDTARARPGNQDHFAEKRRDECLLSPPPGGIRDTLVRGTPRDALVPGRTRPGFITLSPWREGRVSPKQFEAPESGGYSSLKIGAAFSSLRRVPLAAGGMADLTVYPAREGFEGLSDVVSARNPHRMAWTRRLLPAGALCLVRIEGPEGRWPRRCSGIRTADDTIPRGVAGTGGSSDSRRSPVISITVSLSRSPRTSSPGGAWPPSCT